MKGLIIHKMERKGLCCVCKYEIEKGYNSIVLEEYNNKYRYCRPCFLNSVELELNLNIQWSEKK